VAFGVVPFYGPPHLGAPKRRFSEKWVRVGPWAINQIDTSICGYDRIKVLNVHVILL